MDGIARELLQQAAELAAGVIHGEAGLLDRRVGVLGHGPHAVMVARLLNCFGARVRWLAGSLVCPDGQALAAALLDVLTAKRPDLDLEPMRCWATHGCAADDRLTLTGEEPLDIVFVLDELPADGAAAALEAALEIAPHVCLGGQLELLNVPAAAQEWLVEQAGEQRLAVRAREASRLSLLRLAEPLHEYPVAGRDHPAILAHCQARLDFAAQFVAGKEVLEAGSATGLGGRLFLERGARRVVCLDWSAEALRLGREATSDPRIQFCRADLNQPLPLADASFDTIVCLEVLEHIREPAAAVAELTRLLRPDGRLIVSIPDEQCEERWAELNRFRNPYHLRTISRADLLGWLAGFRTIRLAWQRDYLGSAVVPETASHVEGAFRFASPLAGAASVLIAVAERGVLVTPLQPACMQVHANGSELLLGLYQHGRNLDHQLAEERRALWRRINLMAYHERVRRQQQFELSLRDLRRIGGVLICADAAPDEAWRTRLAGLLGPPGERRLRRGAPVYWLRLDEDPPRLEPWFEERRPIEAVLFPVPRRQVGRTLLRRMLALSVSTCWFLEPDGWQCSEPSEADRRARRLDLMRDLLDEWRQQWRAPARTAGG